MNSGTDLDSELLLCVSAAVVYLLARRDRIKRLKHMLSLFDSNFNDRYHYPLVIFHDDFTAHDMATVRASTHTKIEFHQVRARCVRTVYGCWPTPPIRLAGVPCGLLPTHVFIRRLLDYHATCTPDE